ncbi:MAG TPA: M48 family metalloprotease [Chitinophagaceae bacterium]|nr:M48 family metalloprotease [Chitinophagaceae bacterium]
MDLKIVAFISCCLLIFIIAFGQSYQQGVKHHERTIASFDPEKATSELLNTIPVSARNKAKNYSEGGYWLILWNFLYALLIAWLFLFGGLSAQLKMISDKIANRNWSNLSYILSYFMISFLLALPLNIYQNFIRKKQYGFSNQNFIQWFSKDLRSFLMELIIVAPLIVLIYVHLRKENKNWWARGAGISVFLLIGIICVYPVFINLVNKKFFELTNEDLREQVLLMARDNRRHTDQVYAYTETQQIIMFNVNVGGPVGGTLISLNDSILNRYTNNEIKSALRYETGHYLLNNYFKFILEIGLLIIACIKFINWALNILLLKYGQRWKVGDTGDITRLPLFIFLLTCYLFIITPIGNTIKRRSEIHADIYGLNAAREPDAFISVLLKSSHYDKIDPGYWEELFFFDHPSIKNRILNIMKWKADNIIFIPHFSIKELGCKIKIWLYYLPDRLDPGYYQKCKFPA